MPDQLLGPTGLLVAALVSVGTLWRLHLQADTRDQRRLDEANAIGRLALEDLARLADAWEKQVADRAMRRRVSDET